MSRELAAQYVIQGNHHYENDVLDQAFECYREAARHYADVDDAGLATICIYLAKLLVTEQSFRLEVSSSTKSHDVKDDPGLAHYQLLGDLFRRLGDHEQLAQCTNAMFKLADGDLEHLEASRRGDPVFFVAQHKSASEYIRDLLSDCYDLPIVYPTLNSFPHDIPLDDKFAILSNRRVLTRLHSDCGDRILYHLENGRINRLIVHFRDPRQSLLSWIYQGTNRPESFKDHAELFVPKIPTELMGKGFEDWTDWAFKHFYPGMIYWVESWVKNESRLKKTLDLKFTTFEDFISDTPGFLRDFAIFFGLDPTPLDDALRMSNKETHRNFRKGSSTEWRDTFTPSQTEYLWRLIPEQVAERFGWTP
jgi:tetratricopeptide (TPR) repeat protein